MRIYYASQSFYPHIGGVSTYLLNLAKTMVEKGHSITEVHLRPSGEGNFEKVKGVEVHRVPKEPLENEILEGYYKFKEAVYAECHYETREFREEAEHMPGFTEYSKVNDYFGERLRELLEEKPSDIVHIHDFQLLFAYKYVPRGTPLVLTWHIPFPFKMPKKLSKFLIKNLNEYDKVIFSSQEYIDAAVKAGLKKEKAELIYPITDTSMFVPIDTNRAQVRKKLGISQKAMVILSVQRVDQKSGHEQLIRAMPRVLKKIPNAVLVFVGSQSMSTKLSAERGKMREKIDKLVLELGIEKKVIFIGNIEYTLMPEIYSASDITALCSKNEGFGLAITEAMGCAKPVVGTNIGGIALQIENKKNGFLVEVGDYESTANAIIKILKDPVLRKKMGEASLRTVKKFSKEKAIEKHLGVYNRLKKQKNEMYKLECFSKQEISGIITDFDRTITDRPGKPEFDSKDIDVELLRELKSLQIDLFLATGRTLSYAERLCTYFKGYRCVVAENGAAIYFPGTKRAFIINTKHMKKAKKMIARLNLPQTVIGEVIVSVKAKYYSKVKKALGPLLRELNAVRNVDDMMLMPFNTDKGYGLRLAMQYLNIDMESTIIIGDGENDVDMFVNPGYKVALANSHPRLKQLAHEVTKGKATRGVREIIKKLGQANA